MYQCDINKLCRLCQREICSELEYDKQDNLMDCIAQTFVDIYYDYHPSVSGESVRKLLI